MKPLPPKGHWLSRALGRNALRRRLVVLRLHFCVTRPPATSLHLLHAARRFVRLRVPREERIAELRGDRALARVFRGPRTSRKVRPDLSILLLRKNLTL